MKTPQCRTFFTRAGAATFLCLFIVNPLSATIIFTDGFGDGDRDNNGLDALATATDPLDTGIPWLLTDGNTAVTFKAVDDSAGIGTGNALQLFNTSSNNRPSVGHFAQQTLADGDKLILRFDARLVSSTPATADRAIRWGLYHDTNGDDGTADHGSSGTLSVDDVGYNARVDAGNDTTNSTSMDVTRDDTATGTSIIQATTTSLSISSTNAGNQLTDALKHHFELTLQHSGTGMIVTLQEDSNAAITGTDATPTGFVYDEVALGVRSNAAMDMRFDNIQVEYIAAVPEPASIALGIVGTCALLIASRRRTVSSS